MAAFVEKIIAEGVEAVMKLGSKKLSSEAAEKAIREAAEKGFKEGGEEAAEQAARDAARQLLKDSGEFTTEAVGKSSAWRRFMDSAKNKDGDVHQIGSFVMRHPVIAGGITPAGFHDTANRTGYTITISASGANAGYVSFHKEDIFASDCSTISASPNYSIVFVYYLLCSMQNEIYRSQTGGAQPHIHPKDIAPLRVSIPMDIVEQQEIANVLSMIDGEISSLSHEREKYLRLKDGMIQELLTGKTRLI